ncbi:hypothetical protein [Microbispora bryophytorum]|uniref:hypothetical protein n=1 Tax=Microbispora bryophytorum TaxID=1460882 RepID=UPI0033E511B1
MRGDKATMFPIEGDRGVDTGAEVLMDDLAGRAGRDVAARLGLEDAASDRIGRQVVGDDARTPAVQLARDRETPRRTLFHRPDDLHRRLAPVQHVGADVAVNPMRSATISSGTARASASMASKEPSATSSPTSASALTSMLFLSPRSAHGDKFAVSVARSRVCTGGSDARDVPLRSPNKMIEECV